jgi:hypothetical protein
MPDATFRTLCLDASDPRPLAAFWGAALGREVRDDGADEQLVRVSADGLEDGLWVDRVPEARSVKTRVHLDLRLAAADPAPLLAVGARLVREPDGEIRWWVLADPEGNEFCAMAPAPPEWGATPVDSPTPFELVVDSADAQAQATWWAARTGGEAKTRGGTAWWVEGAAGFPWLFWVFTEVPEPKTVKNRLHWDVVLDRGDHSALVGAGAAVLREPDDDVEWWVLADPEGNEFCAFPPSP